MRYLALVILIGAAVCTVPAGEEPDRAPSPKHLPNTHTHAVSERQHTVLSFDIGRAALKSTAHALQRDFRDISLMISMFAGIGYGTASLLFVSAVLCCALFLFGLKKISSQRRTQNGEEDG